MNIFKILASGDGNIDEANVSAFLGYLLDPYGDHGLGDELLRRLLEEFISSENAGELPSQLLNDASYSEGSEIVDLSQGSTFEVEVLLEQAFKNQSTEKKQIVDIVLLIYKRERQKKETIAREILSKNVKRELIQIFLIENKIKTSSAKEIQPISQYENTLGTIQKFDIGKSNEEIKKLISYLYITPDSKETKEIFKAFQDRFPNVSKLHIFWNSISDRNEKLNSSILEILKELVLDSQKADIEGIPSETLYLLKSFINFIDSGFRSRIEEKRSGKMVRDTTSDFQQFREEKRNLLSETMSEYLSSFHNYLRVNFQNLLQRHSKTHLISIFYKGSDNEGNTKFFSISKKGKNFKVEILINNFPTFIDKTKEFEKYLNKENFIFDKSNLKYFIYNKPENEITIEKLSKLFTFTYKFLELNIEKT